jgi:hypothetical protein
LQVVNAMNIESPNWSKMGHLIDEIKEVLGKLRSWRIEHVKRDANFVAHILAREVFSCVIDKVWDEEISNCIYDILTNEQCLLIV